MSELPDAWVSAPLSTLVRVGHPTYGIVKPGEPPATGGVPYVSPDRIDENGLIDEGSLRRVDRAVASQFERTQLVPGDVLVTIRATLDRVAVTPASLDGANISRGIARLSPVKVQSRYLAYALRSPFCQAQIRRAARGVALQGINLADLADLVIPVAPLAEQRRISVALDHYLSLQQRAERDLGVSRAKLARYRAAVLRIACQGRLVPVEAELARAEGRGSAGGTEEIRWIREEREPLPGWQAQPVPSNWGWVGLGQVLLEPPKNGISIKGTDEPPGVPSLRLSAMSDRGFRYDDVKYLPLDDETATALFIRDGDFFVARGNGSLSLVGRGTLARAPPREIVFPDLMIRLRLDRRLVVAEYLATIWPSASIRQQIERSAKTTAGIYKIAQPQLEAVRIPLPPLREQQVIVAEVERRVSVVERLEAAIDRSLARAKRLRQAILKRAFEGRLVPQDPNDEPANALLERIRQERERGAITLGRRKADATRP